jgi:hypothetical protein
VSDLGTRERTSPGRPNGPHVGGLEFERSTARFAPADDSSEDDYLVAGIQKALRLELPLGPCLAEHGDELINPASTPKHRLPLRIIPWQAELEVLVEVLAEEAIDLLGGRLQQIPLDVHAPGELDIFL